MTTNHKTKWRESMIGDENIKKLIEDMRKEHAFITSSAYWGETQHFRAGYLVCLQHIIEKAESYIGDVLK